MVTLRPSPKARAALLAAAPECAAGKKRKKRGRARRVTAERRLKLAREASAGKPPADQARARSPPPTSFAARSPIHGSSRRQRSTRASSRASRSSEPEPRWVTQANQRANESDAMHQGRAAPWSFFTKQKASLKTKGHNKQKGKSGGSENQWNAKGESNDMGQDLPQASPAEPGPNGG